MRGKEPYKEPTNNVIRATDTFGQFIIFFTNIIDFFDIKIDIMLVLTS